MGASLGPQEELNRSIQTSGRDALASDDQGNDNTVAHLCTKVKSRGWVCENAQVKRKERSRELPGGAGATGETAANPDLLDSATIP